MSERENPEEETRISPYLLRPARTYEEYLRDRAIADRLQSQFEVEEARSVSTLARNPTAIAQPPVWKQKTISAE